ncbi:MAG: LrgB family protein [Oscillospiraceae bacterium]|nr:LrgB family protein [Oscillospiraceae bacterium]
MTDFLQGSSFFAVALTLIAFSAASACQKKWKLAVLNPILLSAAAVIVVLKLLDIPNETYQAGCQALSFLLTPATLCLAISFYERFQRLKKHLAAVAAGVLAGTVASIGSVYLLCRLFRLEEALTLSLLPKSVTTAIGAALSQEIGGIAAVSTAVIIITGILGNIIGPALCRLLRFKSEVAQGVAFGTSAHVIGTARATELSELTGAVSSLSLTLAGIVTCIVLSLLAQFL